MLLLHAPLSREDLAFYIKTSIAIMRIGGIVAAELANRFMKIQTKIYQINPNNPEPEIIDLAASAIRQGKLVAFPTETVYGLGANALDEQAVKRIFAAKGRPASDPLIVHVASIDQVDIVATSIPKEARKICEVFWPGPLTIILSRKEGVPGAISANTNTVAVRVPNHAIPLGLIRKAGTPIAAPSANLFMHTSPTTAQHVMDDLDGRVDIILDGGPCPIGVESTVIDMLQIPPVILRPGGVPMENLLQYIPDLQIRQRLLEENTDFSQGDEIPSSPGMFAKHYAPHARFILVVGEPAAVQKKMVEMVRQYLREGLRVGLLVANEDAPHFANLGIEVKSLGFQDNLEQIASGLFAGMRELDKSGVDVILAKEFRAGGLGLAVQDRLVRAAGGITLRAD